MGKTAKSTAEYKRKRNKNKNKTKNKNKNKNKTKNKNKILKTIDTIKGNISIENIDDKKSILISKGNKIKIELIKKFSGGKSGDLVYLIKDNKKEYVIKIFMDHESANHEIKLHNKHCKIFKNNMMVPELFSYGDTINIPFSDKKGKFKYMIMESIDKPIELSDYIRGNCKSNKDKNINSYNLALQIFYYLAMINKNKVRHCDIHTKNILIIKSKSNLILDFSFINGEKINVGKYNIKIIDFGISEINKNCKRNRRFIGAVLNDIKACNAFNKKDIIHIKKDMASMFFSSFSKKFRPNYYINEDLYIFVKILRLLNLITEKLNKTMIDNIQYLIKHNEKGLFDKIYNILVS